MPAIQWLECRMWIFHLEYLSHPLPAWIKYQVMEQTSPLFLGGCLEMPDPLVSLRIIGSGLERKFYYSRRKSLPGRNPNDYLCKNDQIGGCV